MQENLKVKVTADTRNAKANMKGVDSSIKNTVKTILTATVALYAMKKGFDFLKNSTKMAMEQESIFKQLATTIDLNGGSWEKDEKKVKSFFAALQETTIYGDTDSAAMLSQLIAFSGDYQTSLENLSLAQDMASSAAFSSESAARYLGMALAGNVEMLGRFVPELKSTNNELLKTMTASEKAEYALDVLRKKFGGMAENELKTASGQMKQTKNYTVDLREEIGDALLPAIVKVSEAFLGLTKNTMEFLKLADFDLTPMENYAKSMASYSEEQQKQALKVLRYTQEKAFAIIVSYNKKKMLEGGKLSELQANA